MHAGLTSQQALHTAAARLPRTAQGQHTSDRNPPLTIQSFSSPGFNSWQQTTVLIRMHPYNSFVLHPFWWGGCWVAGILFPLFSRIFQMGGIFLKKKKASMPKPTYNLRGLKSRSRNQGLQAGNITKGRCCLLNPSQQARSARQG